MSSYARDDYQYDLPPDLIAQEAIHPHHDARIMVVDRARGSLEHESTFWNLDEYIPDNRVIFLNNSKVLPARIRLKDVGFEKSDTSKGSIKDGEILFCQKQVDGSFEALVRPGNKFQVGTKICIGNGYLEVTWISTNGRYLRAYGMTIEEMMIAYGELPLPPYISYSKSKEADYQTVFAEKSGSVAAPTASLHFTQELLEKLPQEKVCITLHVGLGTFQWVDTPDIRDYHIHREMVEIEKGLFSHIASLKTNGKKILAVGTTVCRTLESLPHLWRSIAREVRESFDPLTRTYWEGLEWDTCYIENIEIRDEIVFFETSIFLYPGKSLMIVDDLITNFHLPESSLLMLVSTLIGRENTLSLYKKAIERKYRFFSFWDGMYIRDS